MILPLCIAIKYLPLIKKKNTNSNPCKHRALSIVFWGLNEPKQSLGDSLIVASAVAAADTAPKRGQKIISGGICRMSILMDIM